VHRKAGFGLAKYGTALQADNGRDWWADAWQEALDMIAYTAQGMMEGDPRAVALHVAALEWGKRQLPGMDTSAGGNAEGGQLPGVNYFQDSSLWR